MKGQSPAGAYPWGSLGGASSLATPDPVAAILSDPFAKLIYLLEATPLDPNRWLFFNGQTHRAILGSHTSVDVRSFECWFFCSGENLAAGTQIIAAHWDGVSWNATGVAWYVQLMHNASGFGGSVQFIIHEGVGQQRLGLTTPAGIDYRDSKWHHLALVMDNGTNGCKIYVDGVLVVQGTKTGTFNAITGPLTISAPVGIPAYFGGRLDEFRYWKKALTQEEVVSRMRSSLQIPVAAEMHGYWKLDDGVGTAYLDSSGNGKTGSLPATAVAPLWNTLGSAASWNQEGIVGLYLANDRFATTPGDAERPNQMFRPRLQQPYNVEVSIMQGNRPAGYNVPGFGDVVAANGDRALDPLLGLIWAERPATIKLGGEALAYNQFQKILAGTISSVEGDAEKIRFRFRDLGYKLRKPLNVPVYRGMGPCLRFDGVNDYAVLNTHTTVASETMACWFRCRGGSARQEIMFLATGTTGNFDVNMIIFLDTSGFINFRIFNGAGSGAFVTITGAVNLRDSAWHHVAGVKVTGGLCSLYVDGVLIGTAATPAFTALVNATLIAGASGIATGTTNWFNGELDEIRLWKKALTQSEIQATMNSEIVAPVAADMHGYWKLNEAIGTSLTDSSGNSKTGTSTGPTWVGSLEGGTELAGLTKPVCLGDQVYYVEPKLVDAQFLIYQYHDRLCEGVWAVEDQGITIPFHSIVTDLYSTPPAPGSWYRSDETKGLIQLGALPAGKVTVTVDARANTSEASDAASLAQKLLTTYAGLTTTDLDTGSFSVLAAAIPGKCAYFISDPTTAADVIGALFDGIGAYATHARDGLLTVKQAPIPENVTGVGIKGVLTDRDCVEGGPRLTRTLTPVHRINYEYKRYWTPRAPDELAGGVAASSRYDLGLEYRTLQSEKPEVRAIHLDSEEIVIRSVIQHIAHANLLSSIAMSMLSKVRRTYEYPLANGLHRWWVGDVITVYSDVYDDLRAGKNMLVIAVREDVASNSASLELWG